MENNPLRQSLEKARSKLTSRYFLDLNGDSRQTIFLASSARSGSTWLGQSLARLSGARLIFEPFHTRNSPLESARNYPPYWRAQSDYSEYFQEVNSILQGKVRGQWTDTLNTQLWVSRRLVKDIHSNLRLGWLINQFPETKFILLLRHPFPVIKSICGMKRATPKIGEMLEQRELREDVLNTYLDIISSAQSDFEKYFVTWCVEQWVPLNCLGHSDRLSLVFYENLCLDPQKELRRLLDFLEISVPASQLEAEAERMKLPSASAFISKSLDKTTKKQIFANYDPQQMIDWRSKLNAEEMTFGLKALAAFGLDSIYNESLLPQWPLR
ncbi:MAG: hypothetical protein GC158_07150 [Cyanobacteria bacterium RI_101]|nr:hypothetical protein [Cyanobacteria bacterium RI_101]